MQNLFAKISGFFGTNQTGLVRESIYLEIPDGYKEMVMHPHKTCYVYDDFNYFVLVYGPVKRELLQDAKNIKDGDKFIEKIVTKSLQTGKIDQISFSEDILGKSQRWIEYSYTYSAENGEETSVYYKALYDFSTTTSGLICFIHKKEEPKPKHVIAGLESLRSSEVGSLATFAHK